MSTPGKQIITHTFTIDGAKYTKRWTMEPIDARQPSEMTLIEEMNADDDAAEAHEEQIRAQRAEVADEVWSTYCAEVDDWHHTARVDVISSELYRVTVTATDTGQVVREAMVTNHTVYVH